MAYANLYIVPSRMHQENSSHQVEEDTASPTFLPPSLTWTWVQKGESSRNFSPDAEPNHTPAAKYLAS